MYMLNFQCHSVVGYTWTNSYRKCYCSQTCFITYPCMSSNWYYTIYQIDGIHSKLVIHFKQSSPGNTIHPLMCYLGNQWYSMFLFVHSESANSIIISDVKQEDDLTCSTLIFHCNIMLVVMGFTRQFKMTTVLTSCWLMFTSWMLVSWGWMGAPAALWLRTWRSDLCKQQQ